MPALKEPAHARTGGNPGRTGHLFDPGGRRTLDDLVTGLLDERSARAATCPVCEEQALSRGPAGALECSACGIRID